MAEADHRKPVPFNFGTNAAESWRLFEQKYDSYMACVFGEKPAKGQAFMLLNLASPEAIDRNCFNIGQNVPTRGHEQSTTSRI